MKLNVRPAAPADAAVIYRFIIELAEYEKARHEVIASEQDIIDTLFAPDSATHALICSRDGEPVGFAVYFTSYSTWLGKNGIYLEDLYVSPAARGIGAGKTLLRQLARIAVEQNCGRLEWSVLDWNEPAIRFYQSIGAAPQDEWIRYRLSGESLTAFARSA